MKRTILAFLGATVVAGSLLAASDQVVVPQKMSKSDLGGKLFERPDMSERTHGDGHTTQDVTTLVSSDKKSDGTKLVVSAGEAVTIPKEWTGVWQTDGYMKIWVIYEGASEP